MNTRFPVIIQPQETKDGLRFRATTSVDRLSGSSRSTEQDLRAVELDYSITLAAVREALKQADRGERRHDPRAYWHAGNAILAMLERLHEAGFYLMRQNETIARDVGLASESVRKIVAFRRRFPRVADVDPQITWARYRGNRVPLPKRGGT